MSSLDIYLEKQAFPFFHIQTDPHPNLGICVIIPCFDEPDILKTLAALRECKNPQSHVEVIVVINYPEHADKQISEFHTSLLHDGKDWAKMNNTSKMKFFFIFAPALKRKYAGVGWARKIGMDEAIYRFNLISNTKGIICSFDADALCDTNYLVEVEKLFLEHTKANACNIYFEHPISGNEYDEKVYHSIQYYELYLRYYVEALRYAEFPYSFHTVGSCFAVKADAYAQQGGMNKRKGGEDFYFLHRIIPFGDFLELNSTIIIPSPRPSHRVPFGTGPVIKKYMEMNDLNENVLCYDYKAFSDLKLFFSTITTLYNVTDKAYQNYLNQLPESVKMFLEVIEFNVVLKEINKNVASESAFIKRFYSRFNAFIVLKYLNATHEKFFTKRNLLNETSKLLSVVYKEKLNKEILPLLSRYREIQKRAILP